MMRSLFARTFVAMIASLLVLTLVAAVFFYLGVRRSVGEWNLYRDQRIQNLVLPIVSRTFRQQAALEREGLEAALLPFLTQNQYLYVFDEGGDAVFLYRNGEILDPVGVSVTQSGAYVGLDGFRPPSALIHSDEIIGFLSAGTLGFTSDPANRQFLFSMMGTLVAVVLAAFGLATVVAGYLSRRITAKTASVASGLEQLARGNRDVHFPESQADEIRTIADSAHNLQSQLLKEERLRRQWAQDVAHDLRTPVTALKTQFEAMIEGVIDPNPERLKLVFAEVERIDELISDLRELNSLEAPEQQLSVDVIDATVFLEALSARFEALIQDRGLEYTFQADDRVFEGDDHLLDRAVSNVVHNAVKYAEPGGRIDVTITSGFPGVVIEVRNSGFVDSETRFHAFDRLYRGENSRGSRGSGLGLSIVRAITDLHKGTVCMQQDDDCTVVRIELPRTIEGKT